MTVVAVAYPDTKPGKLTEVDCFRVGSIGQLYRDDMEGVVTAIREILTKCGVELPCR